MLMPREGEGGRNERTDRAHPGRRRGGLPHGRGDPLRPRPGHGALLRSADRTRPLGTGGRHEPRRAEEHHQAVSRHDRPATTSRSSSRTAEFFVLLGPTGAGKTTTLRVIAGLEKPERASFLRRPADRRLTPAERDVAFVFQQYSLYPTMTVYDNLAFPLRSPLRKTRRRDQGRWRRGGREAAHHAPAAAQDGPALRRRDAARGNRPGHRAQPARLPDGRAAVQPRRQAARVAARRAEAPAEDAGQHDAVRDPRPDRGAHDGGPDRGAQRGHVVQEGTPDDIYDRPATTFVAQLVGTPKINLLEAANRKRHADPAWTATSTCPPARCARDPQNLPTTFILGIRPEDVRPDPAGMFAGEITLTEPLGVETLLHIKIGEQPLSALCRASRRDIRRGQVNFGIVRERLHYFDGTSGLRIAPAHVRDGRRKWQRAIGGAEIDRAGRAAGPSQPGSSTGMASSLTPSLEGLELWSGHL